MRCMLMGSFVLAAVMSFAGVSSAHIDLTSPAPRHADDQQKVSPCGARGDARGETVTVFEPGETITVMWNETIDHPGHFRIMFDDDGFDDFPEPANENDLCEPGVDKGCLLDGIADKKGGSYSAEVTLPDVECDNCTLQLIQVMTDRRPATLYYRCADLVLKSSDPAPASSSASASASASAGAGGGATGAGGGATTSASSSATVGAGGDATTGAGAGTGGGATTGAGAGTGGGATTGAGVDEGSGAAEDDGGCSFGGAAGGAPISAGLGALAALAFAARGRRRGRLAPRRDAAGRRSRRS
ncbi:SCE4755 family polysaccharide monooxygenase-like protein [Sorangium atrum]|uniref:Lytic polysaccharide monooxygenase n=1 Tax=Sorangium atrum TaxID=2995308 RepID=A0ABT5BTK5_9BACT|nr:SCE4755 family polysaccharide monooxygenase-like protein [Sorangium aterium]MDC0676874.1 lytic polysaccharide monooxygenase [Sorangium aterium]